MNTHISKLIILFVTLASLTSCKSPNPNPELSDTIYLDIRNQEEMASKDLDAQLAKLAGAKGDLPGLGPRDPLRPKTIRDIYIMEKAVSGLRQRKEYFTIRKQQRQEYVRENYLRAFNADQPWPNKLEQDEYASRKKLMNVSRNWDDRVPKTNRYEKATPAPIKKESSGGGAH